MARMPRIDWTPRRCALRFRVRRPAGRAEKARTLLYEFLISKRADIIERTKVKVGAKGFPGVTDQERTNGIPLFFDQLIEILKGSGLPNADLDATARKHGDDLLRLGFTVGQVVHDYGNVCQAVTELAFELNADITVDEFHTLNGCLDDATAQAVSEYTRLTDEVRADQHVEQVGDLKRQLR